MLFQRAKFLFSLGAVVAFSTSVWAAPARIVVLGPDAKPLAGAPVRVLERLDYFTVLAPRDLVTDADGVLTLDLDEGKTPRHSYAVRVLVPGFSVAGRESIEAGETKFQLQVAQKWGGVVLDAKQRPVAGVRLRYTGWRPEKWAEELRGFALDSTLGVETVTDAQGRYALDNLPQNGRVSIEIDDPRFEKVAYNLDVSQKAAPPLFVKPGATVTGRIVTPDGKPLGNINLAIFTEGAFKNYKSAPDGTFSVGSLKPDAQSLRAFDVVDGWVLKPLNFELPKPGETRQLPDWVATRALEVTGQVVDAISKKPLAGVAVEIMAESQASVVTDAQGRFKATTSRDIIFARMTSETHLEKTLQEVSVPKAATQYDFGAISLTRGTRIAGTVRDEKGASPRYFSFNLQNKAKSFSEQVAAQDGTLAPLAVPAGTYDLVAQGQEIISPKSITVPEAGEPLAPLQLVVKSEAAAPFQPASLVGRVVDGQGKPVAGAVAIFKGSPNMGLPNINAVSGVDGRFSELFLGEDKPELLGVERPGYVLGTSGEISEVDATATTTWQSGDIVLQPSGQVLSGRVLIAGKPVAGARVALAGNNWREPVRADATGTFRFEDLPGGELELLAAGTDGFASLKTRGDAKNVTLNLEAAPAVDAKAVANGLIAEQPDRWDWRTHWNVFGAAAMETLALRGDEAIDAGGNALPGQGSDLLLAYFTDLARRDPARFLERGPQLLPVFPNGTTKWNAEALLSRVQAASNDADAKIAAGAWFEREKGVARGISTQSVSQLLAMAKVAAQLERPDAASLLDFALTLAVQLPEKTRRDNADVWGNQTARISQAALESLLQDFDAPQQMVALAAAVRTLSRDGDLQNARLDLQKMEALQAAPAIKAADQGERDERGQKFESGSLLSNARRELAVALAPTDAAGALKIAQSLDEEGSQSQKLDVLLEVAQLAHQGGHNEIAVAALREVSASPLHSADQGAHAGAIAMSFDPQLGAELFQKALAQAAPNEQNIRYQPSVATWAFENAAFDPALSRVLLEREWSWRLPAYQAAEAAKKDANEYNYHEGVISDLAWAMSVLDPQRALQWASELPEKNERRAGVKALIAVTLLATPQQRVNFDRYPRYENADY